MLLSYEYFRYARNSEKKISFSSIDGSIFIGLLYGVSINFLFYHSLISAYVLNNFNTSYGVQFSLKAYTYKFLDIFILF